MYKNGDIIRVRHICTPQVSSREVIYEENSNCEPGIRIGKFWWFWNIFFEVNVIAIN